MLKRLTFSALAAAILVTTALSPVEAARFGGRSGGHYSGHSGHLGRWGHWGHHHPRHYRWGYWQGHRWAYGTYATPAAVSACPANCLTKEYLPDGSVVFADRCTNESAISHPRG